MQDVPKIVRERLRGAAALEHPDADVLTAFAEQSLAKMERGIVLEHLARCGDCREIVALALPEDEAVTMVRSVRTPWFARPVLRWGVVAAGIVAIAWFGAARYQHHSEQELAKLPAPVATTEAKNEIPPLPQASATASPAAPAEEKPHRMTRAATRDKADSATASANPQAQIRAAVAGNGASSGVQGVIAPQVRVPPPPFAKERPGDLTAQMGQPKVGGTSGYTTFSRAKPAETANSQVAAVGGPIAESDLASSVAAIPRWTIGATGTLQRSFDQGQTWQDVDVTANRAPMAMNFAKAVSPAAAPGAHAVGKKSVAQTFRVVSATGLEVWAGGSDGVLYHSRDAGNSWMRVAPGAGGVSLTGDVVSVEFLDADHGRVTTSTPEVWATSDGGQSWQKQ